MLKLKLIHANKMPYKIWESFSIEVPVYLEFCGDISNLTRNLSRSSNAVDSFYRFHGKLTHLPLVPHIYVSG